MLVTFCFLLLDYNGMRRSKTQSSAVSDLRDIVTLRSLCKSNRGLRCRNAVLRQRFLLAGGLQRNHDNSWGCEEEVQPSQSNMQPEERLFLDYHCVQREEPPFQTLCYIICGTVCHSSLYERHALWFKMELTFAEALAALSSSTSWKATGP